MTPCMHLFLQIFRYRNLITQLSGNGAGDLPNATTPRSSYMNILKIEEESKIKEVVKDQAIVIICDETTNRKGECVCGIVQNSLGKW
ncbi:hypothetical protein PR048_031845 [Dryococelus australis]|uniref:Transposase n=1 Tax=Dryococelus australis TaxID=614101 RepID=A0ABQ9GAH6_9NEOP|nr:hypothetical protein PR048_031845 [Dryococelus australis]